jgi:hypothetical protein
MVIFGAGASYDSCPTYPPDFKGEVIGGDPLNKHYRPPLANELFENRPIFAEAIFNYFPQCQPIVPRLRSLRGETLEAVLEDLQAKSDSYPRGKQQLASVRYYLQFVIHECQTRWRGVQKGLTNYKSLLDEIERTYPKEPVCLVTFNYDTLLEDALLHFGLPITTMDDYTKKHSFYKLFKLHGSVNWARAVDSPTKAQNPDQGFSVAKDFIERAAEIPVTQKYLLTSEHPPGSVRGIPVFPAIAIPVEKKSTFECPQSMLEELVTLLREVSKILVIGWRATEAHFLAQLANRLTGLRRGAQLHIVAGPDAEEIKVRICRELLNNPPQSPTVDEGGFTDFILSRRAEQFLAR